MDNIKKFIYEPPRLEEILKRLSLGADPGSSATSVLPPDPNPGFPDEED